MIEISLHFKKKHSAPVLDRIVFFGPTPTGPITSCRGGMEHRNRSSNATFQWSSAVKALALLFLRTAAQDDEQYELLGDRDSPAASLDYSLSKQPNWFHAVFGTDQSGECIARRLIARRNSERKRPGPVGLWIDQNVLSPAKIRVTLNGDHVSESDQLREIADEIERVWVGRQRKEERLFADLCSDEQLSVVSAHTRLSVSDAGRELSFFTRIRNISPIPIDGCLFGFQGKPHADDHFTVSSPDRPQIEVIPVRRNANGNQCRIKFGQRLAPSEEISCYIRYRLAEDGDGTSPLWHYVRYPTEQLRLTFEFRQPVRIRHAAVLCVPPRGDEHLDCGDIEIAETPEGYTLVTWSGRAIPAGTKFKLFWNAVTLHERDVTHKVSDTSRCDLNIYQGAGA